MLVLGRKTRESILVDHIRATVVTINVSHQSTILEIRAPFPIVLVACEYGSDQIPPVQDVPPRRQWELVMGPREQLFVQSTKDPQKRCFFSIEEIAVHHAEKSSIAQREYDFVRIGVTADNHLSIARGEIV